jgi:hypothetical protein
MMPSRNAASASDDRFAARRILARSSAMPARIRFPPAARANSAARDIASSACAVCLRWTAMKASRSVSSAWYPSEPSFAASASVVVTSSSASHSTNLHERVGLADERHEGHLQLRHRTRDLKCSLVEVESLFRTTEFNVAVAEQRQPAHQGRGVAACFRNLNCLSQVHDCRVRVALGTCSCWHTFERATSLYPSKEALDAAGTGAADAMVETFAQLDELLLTLGASVGRSLKSPIAVGRVRLSGFNRPECPAAFYTGKPESDGCAPEAWVAEQAESL